MSIRDRAIGAEDFIARLPADQQARIAARAMELIAEELTLRDLRKARALTQVQVASALGIGQDHVSRLEQRADMLLSTLAGYVEAMGGELRLVVAFPDRPPVSLKGLADVFEIEPSRRTKRPRTKGPPRSARGRREAAP